MIFEKCIFGTKLHLLYTCIYVCVYIYIPINTHTYILYKHKHLFPNQLTVINHFDLKKKLTLFKVEERNADIPYDYSANTGHTGFMRETLIFPIQCGLARGGETAAHSITAGHPHPPYIARKRHAKLSL